MTVMRQSMKIIFPASMDKEKRHALRQFQTNKDNHSHFIEDTDKNELSM